VYSSFIPGDIGADEWKARLGIGDE
jgi:hypothetical protein